MIEQSAVVIVQIVDNVVRLGGAFAKELAARRLSATSGRGGAAVGVTDQSGADVRKGVHRIHAGSLHQSERVEIVSRTFVLSIRTSSFLNNEFKWTEKVLRRINIKSSFK